jgi:hypothetical protein
MKSKKNIDVLILTERIESIWNQVYSVNESMTSAERKELINGFEDGINELFGKWAAKAMNFKDKLVGGAKKAWDNMVSKGKEYYEKGKQLAGSAWESMKTFATGVVEKVKSAYSQAVDAIVSSYQSFKASVAKAYQEALTSINQAYESMKDKAQAFAEACKGVWSDILEESALLIQATKEKINSMKEGVSEWFTKNKADLEKSIIEAKSSSVDSLKRAGEMARTALTATAKTAKEIGCVALFICVAPIVGLVNGIKAIPGVYDSAVEMIKNFVEKEAAEYNEFRVKNENLKYIKTFENFKY